MTLREVERKDARRIASIYNYYITNTTITFETTGVSEEEMCFRISQLSKEGLYFVAENDDGVGRILLCTSMEGEGGLQEDV